MEFNILFIYLYIYIYIPYSLTILFSNYAETFRLSKSGKERVTANYHNNPQLGRISLRNSW